MHALLAFVALAIPIALNLCATKLVITDDDLQRRQRRYQLLLVWLIPLVGAILVLGVRRKEEAPSRKYQTGNDAGDDYTFSEKNVKGIGEALDGD